MMLWLNMPANLENSAVATGLEKSVFIPISKKGNAKECSNYHTIALISNTSKVMLKILQARLLEYLNHELPEVQTGFRKGRGTINQFGNNSWIIKKARESQKNIYFCFIDCVTTFHSVDHDNIFFKRQEYQTALPASWEICMQVKKQQLEPDMELWPQIGKWVYQGCTLSPCLFNL